uniref:Integrase, catalytic region, zinc finger, CCHC-type, peptidase aspartic, catalytic n=1 Tax=Tanacetum cinerariifolium TaxID=118510 RepID=A0A6L2JF94_TANCI|nr:integrase, catalytic region, zinc finger, CCHC-type, peptidase aspartic, catalytic [Tanacetum cinerariifolium]
MTESPLVKSSLAVLIFSLGDDLIACLNKAMTFLTAVASSRFPSANNQLKTSFNSRNQATIQDGRVTSNRPRNATWYKDKAMLAEAREAGKILDEAQLTFLVDPGVPDGQAVQTIISNNAAFQTEDLDTYDSDSDDVSNASGLFKLDLEPLAPRLLKNRETHIDYLKYTQEKADILREIVEQAKAKQPLDNVLDFVSNSELICATCKKSMFDDVHDMCLFDFVENMNSRAKSAKKHKKQNIWKPTGHVFTEVGLKWKPTGRTFTIVGVYYVKGLGHNLFSVGQFYDTDLEVTFRKDTCFIGNLEGVDLLLGSRDTNLYTISLDDMLKTSSICLLSKASKTKSCLKPGLHSMTPATSSSGLVPITISQQPCIPPKKDDWDRLFQPMCDEYFNPSTIAVSSVPVVAAPRAVLADSLVSISIEQNSPSATIPSIQEQEHSLNICQGCEESPKTPHFHDDPLHEYLHEDSTS